MLIILCILAFVAGSVFGWLVGSVIGFIVNKFFNIDEDNYDERN